MAQQKVWIEALTGIPSVSREEWGHLGLVSRWLVASRAAVLVMTLTSCAVAGLFALRDGSFHVLPWLVMTIGLVLGHAINNQFNDYTDFVRGVDKDNYFRSQYGPQTVAHGLLSPRQLLRYFGVTTFLVVLMAVILFALDGWDPVIFLLLGIGMAFVLFYTWPLKYIGAGELAVLLVWGPLMIGGGYYALARHWSWQVIWGSIPYVLGPTIVILGKHIDKVRMDAEKGIRTLPVLIGEAAARRLVQVLLIAPYAVLGVLVATRYFTPALLLSLLAIPALVRTFRTFQTPRPETRPDGFPEGKGGWPLYFAPTAFLYTRSFGLWFLVGLAGECVLRLVVPGFWR